MIPRGDGGGVQKQNQKSVSCREDGVGELRGAVHLERGRLKGGELGVVRSTHLAGGWILSSRDASGVSPGFTPLASRLRCVAGAD